MTTLRSAVQNVVSAAFCLTLMACGSDVVDPPTSPGDGVSVDPEITAWLVDNVAAFETPAVRDDRSDLDVIQDIVGATRLVSLGEATHGTREFFRMKHRILDYLVKEMGFTHFAIEATWPEMNRIDDWVQGGPGDPAVLLSGQYFWTWRTEAVMDLLVWARNYNATRGANPAVHVLGFDMQHPGMAIYNVEQFLQQVDPPRTQWAVTNLECVDPNDPAGLFAVRYADRSQTERDACRAQVDSVHAHLVAEQTAYEAASSASAYARALHSARLVQQYEGAESRRVVSARDKWMAENVVWLREQAPPDAGMVLWAHNFHVSDREGAMGRFLRVDHGVDQVIFGFTFNAGSFTAVTQTASGQYQGTESHTVGPAPAETYAAHFASTGLQRFILDLSGPFTEPANRWLVGPRPLRSIGCCYRPSDPGFYFLDTVLPAEFDAIIYFDTTTPSILLPFRPPSDFAGNP